MMYRCILAEILKAKNSYAFWLAWIGTTFVVLALFVIVLAGKPLDMGPAAVNPWKAYVDFCYGGTNFMLLPLFVIIIASLATFMEHKQQMWKYLYVLEVTRWQLYCSKLLVILLLFAAAHAYFVILMLFFGLVIGIVMPEWQFLSHLPDLGQIGTLFFKTIFSILGLLSFQYWVSIRFRSFIVPLGVGVIGFVMATILADQGSLGLLYMPYAYPLLYTRSFQEGYSLASWGVVSEVEVYSLLYALLFVVAGYYNTRNQEV